MSVPQVGNNTFEKGMNSDLSKSLQQPNTYLEAVNFEIITEEGQSSGALINMKGTQLKVTFPNLSSDTQFKDLVPIGWCNIRDDIYVITTAKVNTTLNPGGVNINLSANPATYGHIFKITYNKETLVFNTSIVYSAVMNLSLQHPIANPGMIEGRYENSKIQRIYWTDNFNSLRVINVADPNVSTTPVKLLDVVSNVNFSNVIVEDAIEGGSLPEGVIQVAYRLGTQDGSLTKFSLPSIPFQLDSGNLYGSVIDYPLSDSLNKDNDTLDSEKSIKIKISNLDLDYDYIQLAYIVYTSKGNGEVKLLPSNIIPSTGIYTDIITGIEEGTETFSISEFSALTNPFLTVSTIAQKDNILFVANTKTNEFDLDFDARAYRYKSNGVTYVSFPVAETADAINPYNDENPVTNPDWLANDQYKFKANGTTLGGQGPNVSYTFITKDIVVDTNATEPLGAPFVNVNQVDSTENFNSLDAYPVKSFSNFKSPFVQTLYTGYARGEVYRFGIFFLDKKGNPSFVKWIGDIKMPDNNDTGFDLSSYSTGTATLKSIGIQFTVTIPSEIQSKIEGFTICRVERTDDDKTRLGFGVTGGFISTSVGSLTIDEFIQAISDMAFNIAKSVVSNSNSGLFGGLFSGGIADQFQSAINEALTEIKGGASGSSSIITADGYKTLNEESLRLLVKHAFMSIGTGTVGIVVDSLVGERITELLVDSMGDFIKLKVAGINERILSIGDSIQNKSIGYVLSPTVSFDRYHFRPNDYLRLIGKYDLSNSKIVKDYDRQTDTGVFIADDTVASYRKWFNYTKYTNSDNKRTIRKDKVLEVGEQVFNGFDPATLGSSSADYTLCNAYIGDIERWIDSTTPLIPPSNPFQPKRTLGMGDKKHLIFLSSAMPAVTATTFYSDNPSNGIALTTPRVVDKGGDFLVSYERYLVEQYGGNTYYHRTTNKYIVCSPFIPVYSGSKTFNVFGGDTYVTAFDAVNYAFYMKEVAGYKKPMRLKKALAEIFPVEVSFNTELREEVHFNRNQDKDDLEVPTRREARKEKRKIRRAERKGLEIQTKTIDDKELELALQRFQFDSFIYNDVYDQPNNITKLSHKPLIDSFNEEQSHSISYSSKKIDGELIDSWRTFKPNNTIEVEGSLGPINVLLNHKGRLYFLQNKGIGIGAVNERAISATNIGETVLGNGGVLPRFDYITKEIGTNHKFSVLTTDTAIYFYDVTTNKFYVINSGMPISLSDIKGTTGLLNRSINKEIINNDNPILKKGIAVGYDYKHSRVFFTCHESDNSFTLGYNEQVQAFTAIWSFTPTIYFSDKHGLLSSQYLESTSHLHNKGNYTSFYGIVYPSSVTILSNKYPGNTKIFDAISYSSESKNSIGQDMPIDTFNSVICSTDYQTSTQLTLSNLNTIRRAERSWQFHVPRNTSLERLRDKSLQIKLIYNNTDNNKFTCNYINTQFRVSSR